MKGNHKVSVKELTHIPSRTPLNALRIRLLPPRLLTLLVEQYPYSNKIIGEVKRAQTVDYKTLRPVKDGLFCETIFGPVQDFKCVCGRNRRYWNPLRQFCPFCDVRITSSKARRRRLGYIKLASPVVHVWYLRGRLSYISILLDISRKQAEGITYCTKTADFSKPHADILKNFFKPVLPFLPLPEGEVSLLESCFSVFLIYITHLPEKVDRPINQYKKHLTKQFFFPQSDLLKNTTEKKTVLLQNTNHIKKHNHFFQIRKSVTPQKVGVKKSTSYTPSISSLILSNRDRLPLVILSSLCRSLVPIKRTALLWQVKISSFSSQATTWSVRGTCQPNTDSYFVPRTNIPTCTNVRTNVPRSFFPFSSISKNSLKQEKERPLKDTGKRDPQKTKQQRGRRGGRKKDSFFLKKLKEQGLIQPKNKNKPIFIHITSLSPELRDKLDSALQDGATLPSIFHGGTRKRVTGAILSKLSELVPPKQAALPKLKQVMSSKKINPFFGLLWKKTFRRPSSQGTGGRGVKGQKIDSISSLCKRRPSLHKAKSPSFSFQANNWSVGTLFKKRMHVPTCTNVRANVPRGLASCYQAKLELLLCTLPTEKNSFFERDKGTRVEKVKTANQEGFTFTKVENKNDLYFKSGYLDSTENLIENTGGLAIRKMLNCFNIEKVYLQLINQEIPQLNNQIEELDSCEYVLDEDLRRYKRLVDRRVKKIRRLTLIKSYRRSKMRPEWMTISLLPVLPPTLRPVLPLENGQVAVSDLNKFYQKILYRNTRCLRAEAQNVSAIYAQRLLQEAVDSLLENGKGGSALVLASNGRPLKSLSDILKGKQGRFRQDLLGKRVDYSGRSVIVVGPTLNLHECGLPKQIALELFQPFLVRQLVVKKIATTIVHAKMLIRRQALSALSFRESMKMWEILQQVMKDHPVLLNRAPTLHRLGIQAFQPRLVTGKAILLHPLVCPAFNADFDGDQMAVHLPLSLKAKAEAWKIMWSRNNLLSPATGQPIVAPTQDMVLGCYYLTALKPKDQTQTQKSKSSFWLKENTSLPHTNQIDVSRPVLPRYNESAEKNVNLWSQLWNRKNPVTERPIINDPTSSLPATQSFLDHSFNLFISSWRVCSFIQKNSYFSSFADASKAYYQHQIKVNNPIWVRTDVLFESGAGLEHPLEIRVTSFGNSTTAFSTSQCHYDEMGRVANQYVLTTPGRILLNHIVSTVCFAKPD